MNHPANLKSEEKPDRRRTRMFEEPRTSPTLSCSDASYSQTAMPFLPNLKKKKKRTDHSAEPNPNAILIASQVNQMNMYKRTASGSFASFTDYSDDEGPAEIGSIDSSTLNIDIISREHPGPPATSRGGVTAASEHDDCNEKKRRSIDPDDDVTDHDVPSHARDRKRHCNKLQSKGGGSDDHPSLVSSKSTSPGIGRYASPMYSPPEADQHAGALTLPDESIGRKTDLDGGWACDNCWNLNEAHVGRCSSCNKVQQKDQKSPARKKSAENSKEAGEISRADSSLLSSNKSRKVKVPRRISGKTPALKKLKKSELKPDLRVGDEVWAAWWENRSEGEVCQAESGGWYPGRIKRAWERGDSDYGPQRLYDIEYDDGDELHGVEDVYVVRKKDYELSTRESVAHWKGIALETDDDSTDLWAKRMGWYSVTIEGDEYRFPYLSQALRAYDDSVVRSKGVNAVPSDLNLAEEWKFSKRIRKQDAREKDARAEEIARRLKGCSYIEARGAYTAQISFSGVQNVTKTIGVYELKADAAFAYDEAAKKFGVAASRGLNYSSPDEHLDVRNREMEERGISVNIATLKAKVAERTKDFKPADVKNKCDSTAASSSDGTRKKKKKKAPFSAYELVTFDSGNNVFETRLVDPSSGGKICLGSYDYETDAALAADLGIRHLGANKSIVNFASVDEYHEAKAKEEKAATTPGKCSFTVAEINARVQAALKSKKKSSAKNGSNSKPKSTANQTASTNLPCPHVDPIYDALDAKWGKHLDKKTGREFISDYQHFIQDTMRDLEASDSIKRSGSSREGDVSITNDPFSNDPNAAKLPTVRTVQTATEEDVARDNPRKSFNPESPSKKEAPTFRTLFRKLSSGSGEKKGSLASESRKVTPKSFGSERSTTSNVPTKEVSFQSIPNLPFPVNPSTASKPDEENDGEADEEMHQHYESQQTLPTRHLSKTRHSESPASQPTICLTDEQVDELSLPFPRGCKVWYHLESGKSSTSFRQGTVYEIRMSVIDSKECQYYVKETSSTKTLTFTERELYYAPASPIYLKAPDGLGEAKPGEILLCRALPNPTVNRTHELKKSLDLALEAGTNENIASLLQQLDEIEISRKILAETKVGKTLTNTTKCSDAVLAQKAKEIVQKWKEIAGREKGEMDEEGLKEDHVYVYNVLVSNNEQNHFHIEEGVLPDRVQYRYVTEIDDGENESSNSTITTQPNGGY